VGLRRRGCDAGMARELCRRAEDADDEAAHQRADDEQQEGKRGARPPDLADVIAHGAAPSSRACGLGGLGLLSRRCTKHRCRNHGPERSARRAGAYTFRGCPVVASGDGLPVSRKAF
jgi:hypothetical protein